MSKLGWESGCRLAVWIFGRLGFPSCREQKIGEVCYVKLFSKAIWLVVLILPIAALGASPIIREQGAIYLSDFEVAPLRLRLNKPARVFSDVGMGRCLGVMNYPQVVQAEAFSEIGMRVRGNAGQRGVVGWVAYNDVEGLAEDFINQLRKAEERRQVVEKLIEESEVAVGMTLREVQRSLGKPQKKKRFKSRDGSIETWEYVKYKLVPQTVYTQGSRQVFLTLGSDTNRPPVQIITRRPELYANTLYVKVPVGKTLVAFEDGVVANVEETEQEVSGRFVRVVVPSPIFRQ